MVREWHVAVFEACGKVACGHPVGNEVVFLDPSLIIGVMRGKLNGCEMVNVVVRMPVTKGQFC